MMMHELKILPEYFEAVLAGTKTVELRKEDREQGFVVGDTLRLREYREQGGYTGREVWVMVTHVLRDDHHRWLQPGVVALSITRMPESPTPAQNILASLVELSRQILFENNDWIEATDTFFHRWGESLQALHIDPQVLDMATQEFVRRIRTLRQQLQSARAASETDLPAPSHEIQIDGVVQTTQSRDQWWDAFVTWLESRGELFNGRIGGLGE